MNSPLTSPASSPSSSSSSSLSVFVDPSGSVQPLHLCRSHLLVRPSSHLAQRAAGTCEVPVDALLHATGFNGGGREGVPFAGSCFGGQVIAAPMQNDVSAFYAPPYADGAFFDGWHHSFASAAAAAAAAVGINGMSGGWTTFDPRPIAAAAAGYACGPVGYGVDVRRKNATRESTSTLKAWLFDHIKNPYPTKGEKIMLAIITKMTLTQVSTWFANARRRLKKENKMQWSPRQRPNDDDDDEDDDDRNSLSDENDDVTGRAAKSDVTTEEDGEARAAVDDDDDDVIVDTDCEGTENQFSPTNPSPNRHNGPTKAFEFSGVETTPLSSRSEPNSISPKPDRMTTGCSSPAANVPLPVQHPPLSPAEGAGVVRQGVPLPAPLYVGDDDGVKVKPRIWSLVDTATSGHVSPVDTATSGQELHRPEAAGRCSEAAFPVGRGWEGVGERAFQSWMATVFHHPPVVDPLRHHSSSSSSSSSAAFPRSLYVARPEMCTGSDDHVCGGALESPHYYWSPSALTFGALNGRLDLRELELGRKRHLNAATADQSVDVYSG